MSATLEPVFSGIKNHLASLFSSRPDLQVMLAPPLFQSHPAWYQQSLPWIASQFSSTFSADRPPNLHLLPNLVSQELAPDGASLTPVSGLHYIIHLFDQSVEALGTLTSTHDQQLGDVRERVRFHDDRIAYLENKHLFLNHRVNLKTAADAEFDDWVRNRSEEDWVTIEGLPRLRSDLSDRDWQVEAKRQVRDVIRLVLKINKASVSFEVLLVVNPIKWRKTGRTIYNVRLNSAEASSRIRDIFSGFFRRVGPVSMPPSLKYVSLRNKITLNTKIRIEIMKQLGEKYVLSNQGASYQMRGYEPRPRLIIRPPAGATGADARIRSLFFTDAIALLPTHFSDSQLTQIFMKIGSSNRGLLRQLFVVVSDDDHDRCLELVKKYHEERQSRGSRQGHQGGGSTGQSQDSSTMVHSSFVSGPGAGKDAQARSSTTKLPLSALTQPPPPPPPAKSVRIADKPMSEEPYKGSGHKRRHSSSSSSGASSPLPKSSKHKKKKKHHRRSSSSSSSGSSSGESGSSRASRSSDDERRGKSHSKGKSKSKSKKGSRK